MGLRDYLFKLSYGPGDDRLHQFYVPALRASVRYDRMTGFFTSSALTVAAAGVAHLIASSGQMRLLVRAQLQAEDVEAIREGHDLREVVATRLGLTLPAPDVLADQLMRDRLAALAWMVATGSLKIRVVLPKGPDGLPLPASEARDYFHPKIGVFTDADGHQVAFSGSVTSLRPDGSVTTSSLWSSVLGRKKGGSTWPRRWAALSACGPSASRTGSRSPFLKQPARNSYATLPPAPPPSWRRRVLALCPDTDHLMPDTLLHVLGGDP